MRCEMPGMARFNSENRARGTGRCLRPAAQERIRMLMEREFHRAGDVENRLGYYVGQLGA